MFHGKKNVADPRDLALEEKTLAQLKEDLANIEARIAKHKAPIPNIRNAGFGSAPQAKGPILANLTAEKKAIEDEIAKRERDPHDACTSVP